MVRHIVPLFLGFHYPFTSPANPIVPGGVFFGTLRAPRTYGAQLRINF